MCIELKLPVLCVCKAVIEEGRLRLGIVSIIYRTPTCLARGRFLKSLSVEIMSGGLHHGFSLTALLGIHK